MTEKLSLQEEQAIMKELEQFDTPTITNVIATKVAAKTADTSGWEIWIGIMAVSVLCIGEIVVYMKRRNFF